MVKRLSNGLDRGENLLLDPPAAAAGVIAAATAAVATTLQVSITSLVIEK
jgi:hypothetical protein